MDNEAKNETDKERILSMLTRIGKRCDVEPGQLNENELFIRGGYSGFFTYLKFNEDGSLKIWESGE